MIGAQIKTMLEAEMKASDDFATRNFGLSTGDDFREIVEETLQSTKVSVLLMMNPLMAALMGPKLGKWLAENSADENKERYATKAILANFEAFKLPMQFLYWGIQIGRKLAREETELGVRG